VILESGSQTKDFAGIPGRLRFINGAGQQAPPDMMPAVIPLRQGTGTG
jgi:hypothetical protein